MPSEAFSQYADLLKRLHELIATGDIDSPEADTLREDMEAPWAMLPADEQQLLRGLSHDLYSLSGAEPDLHLTPEQQKEALAAFQRAYETSDWRMALQFLRQAHARLPAEGVAYMRGRLWQQLGYERPAFWFFERAAELNPKKTSYAYLVLDALFKQGRFADAVTRANKFLSESQTHPRIIIGATKILLDNANRLPSEQAHPEYDRIVKSLQEALARDEILPQTERIESITLAGRVYLAMAHERLGDMLKARAAYDMVVARHPNSAEALASRALFRLRTEREVPVDDLEAAVGRGTGSIYPYLFLANHYIHSGNYGRCIEVCTRALTLNTRPDILAQFYEWRAISLHELGASEEIARGDFDRASDLAPANERLRQNIEIFEKHVHEQRAGHVPANIFHFAPAVSPSDAQKELSERLLRAA